MLKRMLLESNAEGFHCFKYQARGDGQAGSAVFRLRRYLQTRRQLECRRAATPSPPCISLLFTYLSRSLLPLLRHADAHTQTHITTPLCPGTDDSPRSSDPLHHHARQRPTTPGPAVLAAHNPPSCPTRSIAMSARPRPRPSPHTKRRPRHAIPQRASVPTKSATMPSGRVS